MRGYKSLKLAIKKAKQLYSMQQIEVRRFEDGSYAAFHYINDDMIEAWTGKLDFVTKDFVDNKTTRIFTFFLTSYRTFDNTF